MAERITSRVSWRVLEDLYIYKQLLQNKTLMQLTALDDGARALEAEERELRKNYHNEIAILRYHAAHPDAHLFTDEGTRNALMQAILALKRLDNKEV